jgi:hypothetical protein
MMTTPWEVQMTRMTSMPMSCEGLAAFNAKHVLASVARGNSGQARGPTTLG